MSSVLFTKSLQQKVAFPQIYFARDTWSASEDKKQTITFKAAYRVYLLFL